VRVIRGKVAAVTGAGSGLGKAIALRLAREGANLHLVDIDLAAAEKVAEEARALGVTAAAAQCDVADLAQLERVVQEMLAHWGGIDILVNNAGVAWYGPTNRMSASEWERLLAINLHAPIHLTRLLLKNFLKRPEAHVLNMASICGWVCSTRFAAYHVSKYGLVGFTEAMRAEFLTRRIGFTAVCPGPVRTNLYRDAPCGNKGKTTPDPPAWLCTTPEKVAAASVRAIYRNQAVKFVSPMAYLLYYSKRLVPWAFNIMHHFGQKRLEDQPAERREAKLKKIREREAQKDAAAAEQPAGEQQDRKAA
jgi:NAD(P)-dependent dehydrogenase (short-subunit alcohol dehydrogenase family)